MTSTIQSATAIALDEDFDKKYEIVNGQPEAKEMGTMRHSGVGTRLIVRLGSYVETHQLGGVYGPDATFLIGTKERLPDVSFLSAARFPTEGEIDEKCPVAPDLAAEIISPNDVWEKVNWKVQEYFAAGVQQVWLISLSARQVHIYDSPKASVVLTAEDELTSEKLLPGFHCRISELFQQPVHA
jgi:Uma2 family endonuclease